ncbi:C2H2 finger domain protein [Aspergillus sclerotialis]|uniref:C2H2 finger domain protein n=1 Tax=Aspergillus sclerotialis TaxID=2070753 RepID=A0A3A2Z8E9_9EURO|nr:C2H2 finger domain protein [Aspergillus sclerotialis]
MGQFHSKSGSTGPDSDEKQIEEKTDYYSLLEVRYDASEEEIKKAYRKKALELHPDRNYGNTEFTTQLFAEIQSAYEVLSDPQERAWYDNHRHALSGAGEDQKSHEYSYNMRMTTSEDIYRLFSQFSPRMEFSDSPKGFYGGLREAFDRLALEEKVACQWEDLQIIDYPTFGYRDYAFDDVRQFYLVWSGFSTNKSFAWKDIYRYSEAPDRRVRRLMEKENRHLREESIREFNSAVRSLVAFAKKRDPRYKANAQSETQRQETIRQASAAQAARSRAANNAKLRDVVTPEWARSEILDEDHFSVSEGELERFECVVCHKDFKNPRQLEAHERSKKHRKAVKQLCWEMESQNRHLGLNTYEEPENTGTGTNGPPLGQCCGDPLPGIPCANDKTRANDSVLNNSSDISGVPSDCQPETGTSTIPGKYLVLDDPSYTNCDENSVSGPEENATDYASREVVERRLQSDPFFDDNDIESLADDVCQNSSNLDVDGSLPSPPRRPLGKAKQKRNKKAAKMAMQQFPELTCATCNACFPSRTQLFRHLRELNHVQELDKVKIKRKGQIH